MNPTRRGGRRGDLSDIDPIVAEGLRHLGLTTYEIRVYDAVLRHPQSRVPEIARESRVPQPKVYATIKSLIEHGLVESHLGPINAYSAIEPEKGFEQLMSDTQRRQRAAMMAIEQLHEAFENAGRGKSRREGRVKLFQGRAVAARYFRELMAKAETHVTIVVRFPLVVADYLDDAKRITRAGGSVRMLIECGADLDDEAAAFVKSAKKSGAELRRISHVPMRMGIFDEQILVLPMNDPSAETGDGFTMLEIRNPGLCASFEEIYDMLWKKARPF